jgi:hypothetical protein
VRVGVDPLDLAVLPAQPGQELDDAELLDEPAVRAARVQALLEDVLPGGDDRRGLGELVDVVLLGQPQLQRPDLTVVKASTSGISPS